MGSASAEPGPIVFVSKSSPAVLLLQIRGRRRDGLLEWTVNNLGHGRDITDRSSNLPTKRRMWV